MAAAARRWRIASPGVCGRDDGERQRWTVGQGRQVEFVLICTPCLQKTCHFFFNRSMSDFDNWHAAS